MRTDWLFLIVSEDNAQAVGAANSAFRDIDLIEEELSRFKAYSDISRLGHLRAGQTMAIGLAAWDCLSLAKDVWAETQGAFDVAIGALYELWRQRPAADPPGRDELEAARARSGSHLFELIEDGFRGKLLADHVQLDLGAIGKGYALDMAAGILREQWEIENALLVTGGGSTVLAMGHDPAGEDWLINAGRDGSPPLPLTNSAVSASGFVFQGAHIINPRTGYPISTSKLRAWAVAPTAALSDALSTAFLVMERAEVEEFCRRHPEITALFAT
ncbi:MAG: FAD:protein FMN transferase [Verrucomicrobiales bacterium]